MKLSQICREEWDFASVPIEHEAGACGYEYSRELPDLHDSKPWLQLTERERVRAERDWRPLVEGRAASPAIRVLSPEEAQDWWNFDGRDGQSLVVAMKIAVGAFTDAELAKAFAKEVATLRAARGLRKPDRRGKRAITFRQQLENLGWMRLRHFLPWSEVLSVAAKEAGRRGALPAELQKAVDDRRYRSRAFFRTLWPENGDPACWEPFARRASPRAK